MSIRRAGFAHPLNLVSSLEDMRDDFERLWSTLSRGPVAATAGSDWQGRPSERLVPAVNVHESDAAVMVEAELPGIDGDDIDISVVNDELILQGKRPPAEGEQPGVTWHRRERPQGEFERRIPLPAAVDATRVEARLLHGVLTITCPKPPQSQPHKVRVQSG
jgi:HSP20 family protein